MAVIKGPGLEVACLNCRQHYLVTESGATPITETDLRQMNYMDAAGQPFSIPPLDVPPIQPNLDGKEEQ